MATTFPLPTLACTITAAGITSPPYADIFQSLQASFQSIYGTDAYIDPDSQDGQLLAIFAKAIYDCNMQTIAAYNNYSPATSQNTGLSNAVKINGIARAVSTSSSALLTLVGQIGTVIENGIVGDAEDNRWLLPASVTIPPAGFIVATATCQTPGTVEAEIGTITQILTPTLGWQSANNPSAASPGAPVELDGALRQRQTVSVALPSRTVLAGIKGAVAAVEGVTQVEIYENDTNAPDSNGLPEHSIAVVATGGDADAIAGAIYLKKTPGAYTYGTTSVIVVDSFGIANTIRYFITDPVPLLAEITIKALTGYTTSVAAQIQDAVAAYINALGIGKRVDIGRLYLPAQLNGQPGFETYEVNAIEISIDPAPVAPTDIDIAFNERASILAADVTVTVVP